MVIYDILVYDVGLPYNVSWMVITMIRCNTKQEFIQLMLHIFFSSERARLEYDEITNLEYEFIQSALGIAQKEHDIANKACEDIEVDLLTEFLNGNHKYKDQAYPVYVDWDIRRWGSESWASVYNFEVYTPYELSMEALIEQQRKANEELLKHRTLFAELKQLKKELSEQ